MCRPGFCGRGTKQNSKQRQTRLHKERRDLKDRSDCRNQGKAGRAWREKTRKQNKQTKNRLSDDSSIQPSDHGISKVPISSHFPEALTLNFLKQEAWEIGVKLHFGPLREKGQSPLDMFPMSESPNKLSNVIVYVISL